MAQQAADRAKKEYEGLSTILLPGQMTRLNEIYVQAAGVQALQDPQIAKQLGITEKQQRQLSEKRDS